VRTREKLSIMKKLNKDPFFIKNVDKPTDEMILTCASLNYKSLEFINNIPEHLYLKLFETNPNTFNYFKNPSEDLKLKAVSVNAFFIKIIDRSHSFPPFDTNETILTYG